jgi:NAD+--asparagine ADP-ribosyltransferase
MKRFNEFIYENNKYSTFDDFLDDLKIAIINDFNQTSEQADVFIQTYYGIIEDSWKNNYSIRETLTSINRPGFLLDNNKIDENYLFEIDILYENCINDINSNKHIKILERNINNYYNHFYKMNISDKRIFERIKNNYNNLINLLKQKIDNNENI